MLVSHDESRMDPVKMLTSLQELQSQEGEVW